MARAARRGQSLVETALVALVLYLLLAATVELGRATFGAQVLQDAARVAARELALLPLPAAEAAPGVPLRLLSSPPDLAADVLERDDVRRLVFDPSWLVIDLDQHPDPEALFADGRLPPVNRQLRPLFVFEQVEVGGVTRRLLRYPGALLVDPRAPASTLGPLSGLTVAVPRVDVAAGEVVEWLPVVGPVGPGLADDPLRLDPAAPGGGGLVALRLVYPFQAAALSGFQETNADPFDPNLAAPVEADPPVDLTAGPPAPLAGAAEGVGTHSGALGLGRQLALGREVRPFRRVQVAQAVFRREVLE